MTQTEELLEIKKKIDDAGIRVAQEQGKIEAANKRLKEEFDLKSVEDADELATKLSEEIEKNEELLTKGIADIKQKFNL